MIARIFTCVCGFVPKTYSSQRRHRSKCLAWKDRRDPRGLMLQRQKETNRTSEGRKRCEECRRFMPHHKSDCSHSLSEASREAVIERSGLRPLQFSLLLQWLRKRYPDGLSG